MTATNSRGLHKYLGLALISASVLALQVIFTRIFSIMIWYHFTYLVVGVALLGGGAAGTYLAIQQWNTASLRQRLGKLAMGFSLSISASLLAVSTVSFDPLGGRAQFGPILFGLAVYFSCLFAIFFLGGLMVAGVFRLWAEDAHRLYFADLLGASLSTVGVVGLIYGLGGPAALAIVALLALASAYLFGDAQSATTTRRGLALLTLGQLVVVIGVGLNPIQLPMAESKSLVGLLQLVGARLPEYVRWNPVARVDVTPLYDSPNPAAIVGDLSSVYSSAEHVAAVHNGDPDFGLRGEQVRFVTLDGTSMTTLHEFDGQMDAADRARFHFVEHAIIGAPYLVSVEQPDVLLIGIGGGVDILQAFYYDARRITAIDINSDVVALLTGPYQDFTGRLDNDPRTTILTAEGRNFLNRTTDEYDIIQGIGLDNAAALAAGAYIFSEAYIYTVEAYDEALERLSPEGVFAWTRNLNQTPREMLRLTGLAAEALRRRGVSAPARYISVIANEQNTKATLLVRRTPFTEAQAKRLREWAAANNFIVLQDPGQRLDTIYADYIHAADPRAFEAGYVFNISPVTDDNPFFYNYWRWTDIRVGGGEQQGSPDSTWPIGNLVMLAMLSFSTLAAVAFIGVPLWRYRRAGLQTPQARPMLVYFSLLGLGYIFVEIVLIQRFTLFIGYPTQAITTTIFSMLLFSALGSLVSQRLCRTPAHLRGVLILLSGLLLVYIVGLPALFSALLGLDDWLRTGLSVIFIAPLGFLMGMPFPTGLRQLGLRAPELVPWAWGVNGVFSVLGSTLVILFSMWHSFTAAFVGAAAFYGLASLICTALWRAASQLHPAPMASGHDDVLQV